MTVTLIVTIVLAFVGYLVTYLNSLRLTRRKERLELINRRINEFYGPLFIASQAGQTSYETLLNKLNIESIFEREKLPNEDELREWRFWCKSIFAPLNELREKLILENAYLIREEKIPQCLIDFVTHVSAFKVILKKWESDDFSEHTPELDFPIELGKYAENSYRELKNEQLKLIGKQK